MYLTEPKLSDKLTKQVPVSLLILSGYGCEATGHI